MTYYTLWVARDLDGALRIYSEEPVYGETLWLPSPGTHWFRKLPPRWFPDLKPGTKVRCQLGQAANLGSRPLRKEGT